MLKQNVSAVEAELSFAALVAACRQQLPARDWDTNPDTN